MTPIDDAAEFPPDKFINIPGDVRNWLATLSPAQLEALSSLQPSDVSTLRAGTHGHTKEAGMNGSADPIGRLQTVVGRWFIMAFGGIVVSGFIASYSIVGRFNALESAQSRDETWKAEHLTFHRDRQKENADSASSLGTKIAAIEGQLPQIAQHNYRIGQVEEGLRSTNARIDTSINQLNATISAMAKDISALAADIRVMRLQYATDDKDAPRAPR